MKFGILKEKDHPNVEAIKTQAIRLLTEATKIITRFNNIILPKSTGVVMDYDVPRYYECANLYAAIEVEVGEKIAPISFDLTELMTTIEQQLYIWNHQRQPTSGDINAMRRALADGYAVNDGSV